MHKNFYVYGTVNQEVFKEIKMCGVNTAILFLSFACLNFAFDVTHKSYSTAKFPQSTILSSWVLQSSVAATVT